MTLAHLPHSPRGRVIGWALAAVCLLAAAVSAYCQLFTTFRFWDDEGYLLVSLRNFAAGGALYSEVFSQYGPAYNLLHAGLHRLGVPLDTAGARHITLGSWLVATVAAVGLMRRLTGSPGWALAAGAAVFTILRQLTHEPLHPVAMIAWVLFVGTAAIVQALLAERRTLAAVAAGVTGATLTLVKINVGLFFLAGAGVFFLWTTATVASRPGARAALIVAAGAAGVVLMRPLLGESWVRTFLIVYVCSAIPALVVAAAELRRGDGPDRSLQVFLWATGAALASILAIALIAGIGPAQLWEGIVRGPLRHPTGFSYPHRWAGLTFPVLTANVLGCAVYAVLRHRRPASAEIGVALARVIVGAGLLLSFYHAFAVSVENFLLSFGTGFLWCLVAPLGAVSRPAQHARVFIALLALFQILHAFPVAGTQVNLGTVLLAVLVIIALAEVVVWARLRDWRVVGAGLTLLAAALPAWGAVRLSLEAVRAYARQPTESLTGAHLHLSPWQASAFSALVRNAAVHGDMLFSLPGLFSFNLWTELPTPTRQNITHWWSLLDDDAQRAIAERLDAAPRPVIIVQRNLITSGLAMSSYRPSLLTRFIGERFTRLLAIDSYELWVRHGTDAEPVGIGNWRDSSPAHFEFYWPTENAARPPARLEWVDFPRERSQSVAHHEFSLTRGPTAAGLTRWSCTLAQPPPLGRGESDAARFLAADGTLLMEIRFPRAEPQLNPK